MPMIMMLNLKGGVAKTTNAVAIAECLAHQGKKVLMIDADHQSMAGELLLGQQKLEWNENHRITLHDLFSDMLNEKFNTDRLSHYITNNASRVQDIRVNLDCICCSHRIDEFSTNMAKAKKGYQSNEEFLRRLNRLRKDFNRWCNREYDMTLIDCPPSFALQVQFLLGCADAYIVPSLPDRLSLRGSLYLLQRLRLRSYTRIRSLGTLWCMVRVQVKKHLEIMEKARKRTGEYANLPEPFDTYIPNMSAIADATDSEMEYDHYKLKYQSQVQRLFQNLCGEIEQRISSPSVESVVE